VKDAFQKIHGQGGSILIAAAERGEGPKVLLELLGVIGKNARIDPAAIKKNGHRGRPASLLAPRHDDEVSGKPQTCLSSSSADRAPGEVGGHPGSWQKVIHVTPSTSLPIPC
jgi:hypothetical protein